MHFAYSLIINWFCITIVFKLSNGPDKKERPKRREHVGMQKGANFNIVSTMVLIGLNIRFYEIFAKQHVH